MSEHAPLCSLLDEVLASRLGAASRCFVAYSGGLDSTALLHLVDGWCRAHPDAPELAAWHVNHGMQAAADDWEAHCARTCDEWGVAFRSDGVSVEPDGRGSEAAAREARYAVFERGLGEGEVLLMAHHLDDQVETFFLRLMRGAGLRGMSGMPLERSLGKGFLLRPLLEIGREDLQCYVHERALSYIEDPSNADTSLDRNFLRQEIMPALERRWSGYRQTVTRASGHVASALATLEDHLPKPVTVYSTLGDPGVPLQVLRSGARDVATIRLRSWLHERGLPMPTRTVVDEFLRQVNEGGEESTPRLDCGSYVMQRYGDAVYLVPDAWDERPDPVYTLAPGDSCTVAGVGVLSMVRAATEGLVLDDHEVLQIGWRSGGERCRPQGRAHSQTLKKLLQERAVPPWWRERVPLVFLDDELLAVGGLWFCETSRLKQTSETDQALWQLHWQRNTFAVAD